MRLISRYLLRQLAAPFIYALATLTAFMLLNQVAKRFGALVGKGLEWSIIAEVFALSVPFIVAMTFPMAVLVAVLYTFSHLAADNEITAARASGISLPQLIGPILVWGGVMAAINFVFVDQVLPRSNSQLKSLLIDIGRKKPTLELREQVINEIPPSSYFLRVGRIDAGTGQLRNVTIYDLGSPDLRRVIYADSGLMAYAPGRTDLSLRLYHGEVHEFKPSDPELFQLTYFTDNSIRIKDVFNELERNSVEVTRGDREMTTCQMQGIVDTAAWNMRRARQDRLELTRRDLRTLLSLPPAPKPPPVTPPGRGGYCGWWLAAGRALLPETALAQSPAQARQPVADTAPAAGRKHREPVQLTRWAVAASQGTRIAQARDAMDRYNVEINKKWSISLACLPFVLIGVVLALRFPRGGMGLVIGGSLAVFSLYYVGLTAGESLADRGVVGPAVAMWAANAILLLLGLIGLVRVNRESGSTRGGDLQELAEWLRSLARRSLVWRRARP